MNVQARRHRYQPREGRRQSPAPPILERTKPDWFVRTAHIATVVSGFGTLATAIIATIVLLNRDMAQENIKLLSETLSLLNQKVGLVGDRAALRSENLGLQDRQRWLASDNRQAQADLANARDERSNLQQRVSELGVETARRDAEITRGKAELASLRDDLSKTSLQRDEVSSALKSTAGRLLKMGFVFHLRGHEPKFSALVGSGVYTYLIAPDDRMFISDGQPNAYFIATSDEGAIAPADLDQTCQVRPGVRAFGYRIGSRDQRFQMSFIKGSRDPVFQRVCAYLAAPVSVVEMPSRRVSVSTVYDAIKHPETGTVVISLIPGAMGGLRYEEFKVRGFWFPVLGSLYRSEAYQLLDQSQGGLFTRMAMDPRTAPRDIDLDMASTQQAFGKLMEGPDGAALAEPAQQADTAWTAYLDTASTIIALKPYKFKVGPDYPVLLHRYAFSELGSVEFNDDRDAVRTFDFKVMCAGVDFALNANLVSAPETERAVECKLLRALEESMMKRPFVRSSDKPGLKPKR